MSASRLSRLAPMALLLMAVLWGSTLIVMKDAYATMRPTDLLANRYLVALLAFGVLMPRAWRTDRRTMLRGLGIGGLFGAGQVLQGVGLATTPASVNGFIGGLYVVATPLLGAVLLGGRVSRRVWMAVGLATLGLAGLALNPADLSSGIGLGQLITLAAALCYAGQILFLGRVATAETVRSLGLYQVLGTTIVCLVVAAPGGIQIASGSHQWLAVLYLGLLCGAAVTLLQSWAQARVEPNRAAVLMCTEPLWGAVFAIGLAGESLTVSVVIGSVAILAAMVLVVAPARRRPVWRGRLARPEQLTTAS
ncbi:DMT family transporter [Acidipropionibacterium thoenii]|uniref:DMT family transporter n=1 Tax=Acidipropionibacterium thoenii TaxID=1751 RepID=UPI0008DB5666|nr:DMT family transporter [Acidipropionibacterium thoenii]